MTHPEAGVESLVAELRRYDPDRFLVSLFAPSEWRDAYWALLAFNLEIAKIRESVTLPIMGQIRLQWWREAIDEIYGGGIVRRHFVATPLSAAVRRHRIRRFHLDRMVDAREFDLDDAPFQSLDALREYAEATSGALLEAMLDVAQISDTLVRGAAQQVGAAWAIVGLVRAMPFHAGEGKSFVPQDISEFTGIEQAQPRHGPGSPATKEAASLIADAARRALADARDLAGGRLPKAAAPVALLARMTRRYLKALQAL